MFTTNLRLICSALLMSLFVASGVATGKTPESSVSQSSNGESHWKFDGLARFGFFDNHYQTVVPTKRTYSLGGALELETPQYGPFSVGLAAYAAVPLGARDKSKREHQMPGRSLIALPEAYVEYDANNLNIKLGNQKLDTPFAKSSDLMMIPLAYRGLSVDYATSKKGLSLHGARIDRFKPYNDHFIKGDSGSRSEPYLNNAAANTPSVESSGFSALGATYEKGRNMSAQAWYYHMNDRLEMLYSDFSMTIPKSFFGQRPFFGLQYLREWSGTDVDNVYKNVDSQLYGLKVGFKNRFNTFYIAYSNNPRRNGAMRGGGVVSPYQRGPYNESPIFTRHPLANVVTAEQPGHAFAVRDIVHVNQYVFVLGYTHLRYKDATDYHGNHLRGHTSDATFAAAHIPLTENSKLRFLVSYVNTGTPVPKRIVATRLFLNYRF